MSKTSTALYIANGVGYEEFRQHRHHNEEGVLALRISGSSSKVVNWSRTGLGFECTEKKGFEMGQKIQDVNISVGNITIYQGEIEIKMVTPLNSETTYYGASFNSALFLVEGVEAAVAVDRCTKNLKATTQEIEKVDPEVCRIILVLSTALFQIKKVCEVEETKVKALPFDRKIEADRVFLPAMSKEVKRVLGSFNVQMAKALDVDSLSQDSIYHRLFEDLIYPYFESADLARRAKEKPRGYAGDYEMMNQIYRSGYEGNDLFGKVLHHYSANEDSSESVQFRRPYFLKSYAEVKGKPGSHSILSVACGPAVEYQEVIKNWTQVDLDRVHVTLFDLDREALEYAQTKIYELAIETKKKPNVTFINASVKTFLTYNQENLTKYDFIYSGGLFDYLDNPTSKALVTKFFSILKPGGKLIIGNFTKDNSTKAFLSLITKWDLIHKTPEEILAWGSELTGAKLELEFDTNHINAFLVARKNEIS